jgi:hypothetical protein
VRHAAEVPKPNAARLSSLENEKKDFASHCAHE